MRELKFRAWDKKQKKILYGVSIGTIKVWDENKPLFSDEFSYNEDCIFEQYTGLKDKNGREIYEGDIIRYLGGSKERIGQIVFDFVDDSEGYYVAKHYGWAIRRDDYNNSIGDYPDDNMKCEQIEVIGNIHENPELLG